MAGFNDRTVILIVILIFIVIVVVVFEVAELAPGVERLQRRVPVRITYDTRQRAIDHQLCQLARTLFWLTLRVA